MRFEILRDEIRIIPDGSFCQGDERDLSYIEEVLGLIKAGDYVKLERINVVGVGALAYLRAKRE